MSTVNDVEELKTKVLDQRISLNNMADRVMALEDQFEALSEITSELIDAVRCINEVTKDSL